jgi:hypothetical protein
MAAQNGGKLGVAEKERETATADLEEDPLQKMMAQLRE